MKHRFKHRAKPKTSADFYSVAALEIENVKSLMGESTRARNLETAYHHVRAAEGRAKVALKALRALKFELRDELKLDASIKGFKDND